MVEGYRTGEASHTMTMMRTCCNCSSICSEGRKKRRQRYRNAGRPASVVLIGTAVAFLGVARTAAAAVAAGGFPPSTSLGGWVASGKTRAHGRRSSSAELWGGQENGKHRCSAAATTVGAVRGGAGTDASEENENDQESTVERGGLGSVTDERGLTNSVKGLFFKLLSAVGQLLGVRSSVGGGGSLNISAGGGFAANFEAKYGKTHPRFNDKSLGDAAEQAWSRNRLCLVYIPSGRSRGKEGKIDDAICKALADQKVSAFVDSNFVMWVPGGKGKSKSKKNRGATSAAAAAKQVGARSLPFLGVIHSSSSTNKMTLERKLKRSTVALHHCNPPPSSRQMVSWMTRVLELQKGPLEKERDEQQRLKDEDTIYTERVQGYSKSLKDDALREVREAKEAAERARLEEQERAAQAAREEKERQDAERRAQKALDLGKEPSEAGGGTVSTLMLRLADGSRVRRRFLRSGVMRDVFNWADVQGVDLDAQRLSSSFPKASFSYPEDCDMAIEDTGLGKQALLFVEQRAKEAIIDTAKQNAEGKTSDEGG